MTRIFSLNRWILVAGMGMLLFPYEGGGSAGATSSSPRPLPPTTWLIMVYIAADNNVERNALLDLNEMEAANTSVNVTTVVQIDTKTLQIDGKTTAQRLEVQSDTETGNVTSPILENLGEIDSCDPSKVVEFVEWAKSNYTADRYVLILWDHGTSWAGFGVDETNFPSNHPSSLNFSELKSMFLDIYNSLGQEKLDMIAFDACLMSGLEIAQMVAPYADYLVASSDVVQPISWYYTGHLNDLVADPDMSVSSFGQKICDRYVAKCATDEKYPSSVTTLSVTKLSGVAALVTAVNAFAESLLTNMTGQFTECISPMRRHTVEYGWTDVHLHQWGYVDLEQFASKVALATTEPSLATAANGVVSAVGTAIEYKATGTGVSYHGGISIYFPLKSVSSAYSNVDLSSTTQWDEFLVSYHDHSGAVTTLPSVLVTSSGCGSVSPLNPRSYTYTVLGNDVHIVKERYMESASDLGIEFQYAQILWGERVLHDSGETPFPRVITTFQHSWDGRAFVISDATGMYAYLGAVKANGGESNRYCAKVLYTPAGGDNSDEITVDLMLHLNWEEGTGSIEGVYSQSTTESGGGAFGDALAPRRSDYASIGDD